MLYLRYRQLMLNNRYAEEEKTHHPARVSRDREDDARAPSPAEDSSPAEEMRIDTTKNSADMTTRVLEVAMRMHR